MAATYTPNDAFTFANYMTKQMRLSNVRYDILDEACSRVWMAAPWSWTIAALPVITVAANTVDYSVSGNYPTDFAYIYKAILYDSEKILKPLRVAQVLPATPGRTGQILTVAPVVGTNQLRVYPSPPATLPSNTQRILLLYKKNPPKITSSNAGTAGALVMDDRWFHVYKSAVLLSAYKYADDARGYDITRDPMNGQTKLGGELANFEYLIGEMKKSEKFDYEWDTYAEAAGESR